MRWSEITQTPPPKMLRQFAGLFLVFFVSLAAWRAWNGQADVWALSLAGMGLGVGTVGLVWPTAIRWIYTGWMIAAFPIGWTVSWLVLAALFYWVFTPVAFVFRLRQRDALRLRRGDRSSYWTAKERPLGVASYFRQF